MSVRILTVPLAVVLERRPRRVEVPLGLRRVLRLQKQAHLDAWQRRVLEAGGPFQKVRTRRPREIVHVFLIVTVRRHAAAVGGARALDTGGSDEPAVRDRQRYIVDAERSEEHTYK